MKKAIKKAINERRRYIRLDAAFPVECQLIDEKNEPKSPILQGFTRNIGKGGMCIEIKSEKGKVPFELEPNKTKFKLIINIPSSVLATDSYATLRWSKKISEYVLDTYLFGVEYDEIESDNQKMIERHVLWAHRKPKIIFAFFFVLLVFSILITYLTVRF